MSGFNIQVDGDIPAHRVLKIYRDASFDMPRVGLPDERGAHIEYASTVALEDGQVIHHTLRNGDLIEVLSSTPVMRGAYVAADTDGTVGIYNDAPVFVGISQDFSQTAGEIIRVVKLPRVNQNLKPAQQDLSALTVPELRAKAKAANVTGYSSMTKAELITALQQDAEG